MTFDLVTLLLFGPLIGICVGLIVYAFNLRSALLSSELQNQSDASLALALRNERDQSLQKAIRLESELDSEKKLGLGRIESLSEAKEALSLQFKNLANDILEEKSRRFTEQNAVHLDALLKPLQTKLTEFKEQVSNSYGNEARERFALKGEIERLANLNLRMSDETRSLTQALKGDSKVQGNWGELVLESILESSGLRKGEEYLQSLRQHIQSLSGKNYSSLYGLGSVDFVLMFIPIEPAFLLALKTAPNLYQEALSKNIVLVCPSTLMATLRTVAHLWRQDQQNRNALEIARQCGTLYDKFVGFVDDLEKLGQRLDQAQTSYHDAFNKLKTGKGNLIRSAERVRELGVKPSKSLPTPLIESSNPDLNE